MQQREKPLKYVGQHSSLIEFLQHIRVCKDDAQSLEELAQGVQILRNDKEHHDPYAQHWEVDAKEYYLKECFLALHKKSPPTPQQKEPLEDQFNQVARVLKNPHGVFMSVSLSDFRKLLDAHAQNKAIIDLLEDSLVANRKFELDPLRSNSLSASVLSSIFGRPEVRKLRQEIKAAKPPHLRPR
jgi:hypothetical protein